MKHQTSSMAGTPLPEVTVLSQELNNRVDQWNKAERSLKIGNTYAEIYLRPEGDSWKGQGGNKLMVVHPVHGEIDLFCPIPKTPYPGTWSSNGTAKMAALIAGLEELTTYLQEWVRDFAS
jgi:hypothetical protein